MQLKTDSRCRIASRDLFRPNASYEAEKTPDGAIRLVELVPKTSKRGKPWVMPPESRQGAVGDLSAPCWGDWE